MVQQDLQTSTMICQLATGCRTPEEASDKITHMICSHVWNDPGKRGIECLGTGCLAWLVAAAMVMVMIAHTPGRYLLKNGGR